MEFFSEVKNMFNVQEIKASERLDYVEASFKLHSLNLPSEENIKKIFSLLPSRDNLKIELDYYGVNSVVITKNDIYKINKFSNELDDEGEIDIKIEIKKRVVRNIFSIYKYESFIEHLKKYNFVDLMRWFSKLFQGKNKLIFEVFDSNVFLATKTMAFISDRNVIFNSNIERIQKLNLCKNISYFQNANEIELLPDDFMIEGIIRNTCGLELILFKLKTILTIIYISSTSRIDKEFLEVRINGYRIIDSKIQLNEIPKDDILEKLYEWIYTDGNTADKFLLAHNIISIYCKDTNSLCLNKQIFATIATNYNLYLKKNIDNYLKTKREISEFIQNTIRQIQEDSLVIFREFKKNLFAILAFLFTVVITKVGETQKFNNMFTKEMVYVIIVVLICSVIYLIITYFEMKEKLNNSTYRYYELKNNYKDILSELEITKMFNDDNLLKIPLKKAYQKAKLWSLIWGTMAGIMIIILFVINK